CARREVVALYAMDYW
nr:immunoglobulin heavy chain junction region [Mus musculus]